MLSIGQKPIFETTRRMSATLLGLLCLLCAMAPSAFGQVPQISLPLVPSSAAPGSLAPTSPGLTVTVNGTGFTASSVVNWDGSPRATSFVSTTKLTATVTPEDVESPGTAWVSVVTPGVGASNVAYFEITNPTTSVSFTKTDYVGDLYPYSPAVGDFNGDGKLDLVVANNAGGDVSVFLGNGDGTFQAARNYPAGSYPIFVTVGDFNGDGELDLAVANGYGGVNVLMGNGDGTFRAPVNYQVGTHNFTTSISITVGDFNGDGKLDLAVADFYGIYGGNGNLAVLLGNGDGTFQAPAFYAAGGNPHSVAVGDFNGDGKLDLAVANQSNVSILLGNGDGTFQAAQEYTAGAGPVSVAVADFNGDGKEDLALANLGSGDVSVLLGNGDGTFQAPVNYASGTSPQSVTVGDFNGDGKMDLALANTGSGNLSVLLGNGDGTFQAAQKYTAGAGPVSVTVGDFNGDGRMDLAASDATSDNLVSILLQPAPAGSFARLNGSNTFNGNQMVNGTVSATSFVGNGSGLTNVTASGLNCAGCVGNTQLGITYAAGDAQGGNALNALSLGGNPASFFAPFLGDPNYAPASGGNYVAKAGDTMTGNLNLPNLNSSGKVSANGSLVVGSSGTAIAKHLSMLFSPSFPALKPSTCSTLSLAFAGASDGDSIGLGVPNAMMAASGIPSYTAWVSAANTIIIRACNLDPNTPQKSGTSGTIRVDVWKH